MQYRTVSKNGDKLSVLGFGCMRLPMKGTVVDENAAVKLIRDAIDKGVNYFDTAWPYHDGNSEKILGMALKDGYREKVKIATKLPSWLINSREDMDYYLNAQLEKLEVEYIDYYMLHGLDGELWEKVNNLNILNFLDDTKADKRIVNAGFSFHGLSNEFVQIVDSYDWTFCMIQYNYLDTEYQAGRKGLEYASSKDIAVMIMEPLRGGTLALPEPPPKIASIWNEAEAKRTPAEWALRWLWNQPEITTVLSGMNNVNELNENLTTADSVRVNELNESELEIVERVGKKYHELMKVNCTGCGYCMPCPANVMIPMCFEEYNKYNMFGKEENAMFYKIRMSGKFGTGKPGYASQCIECGVCLKKCPQNVQIPEALKEVASILESFF